MTKKGPAWSLPGATALPGPRVVSGWHGSELHPGALLGKAGFVLLPPPAALPQPHPAGTGEEEPITRSGGN